jgi:hypothetical protein
MVKMSLIENNAHLLTITISNNIKREVIFINFEQDFGSLTTQQKN